MDRRTVTLNLDDLKAALKEAVRDGCKDFVKDPEVQAMVGESFYKSFLSHGSKDAKQWVGGKVIASIATIFLAAAITFYVKHGAR